MQRIISLLLELWLWIKHLVTGLRSQASQNLQVDNSLYQQKINSVKVGDGPGVSLIRDSPVTPVSYAEHAPVYSPYKTDIEPLPEPHSLNVTHSGSSKAQKASDDNQCLPIIAPADKFAPAGDNPPQHLESRAEEKRTSDMAIDDPLPPTLVAMFERRIFGAEFYRYLSPNDIFHLGQTCQSLRDICFEKYVLGKIIKNSSIDCHTLYQRDPPPEPPERERQLLFPVLRRVNTDERGRCVPKGRIVFERDPNCDAYFFFRLKNFEPNMIEFLSGGNGLRHRWELEKTRCTASRYDHDEWNGTCPPTPVGRVFHRFEDFNIVNEHDLDDTIPVYVFYKMYGPDVRLHAVSIPIGWLMDRLSRAPPYR